MKPISIQEKIIEGIFDALVSEPIPRGAGAGFYSGLFGRLLFLTRAVECFPEKADRVESYAEKCFELICSQPQIHTYCNGMAGILECLKYIAHRGRFDIDYSEIEASYRPLLLRKMQQDFAGGGDYDLLHGAMGVAYHFRADETFATEAVRWLRRTAVSDDGKLKWASVLPPADRGVRGYNICLSHGISGVLLVLCALARHQSDNTDIIALIDGASRYLLSQEYDDPHVCGCHFPSVSLESQSEPSQSRLAWCYGDPGIAVALWNAGKALNDEKLKDKARVVMRHAAGRRTLHETSVYDAGLCHGSTGVAMIFHYMYRQTGDETLREARDFWHYRTLEHSCRPDGTAGYKFFFPTENPSWRSDTSLLSGISGVGLWILSMLYEADDPQAFDWLPLFFLI